MDAFPEYKGEDSQRLVTCSDVCTRNSALASKKFQTIEKKVGNPVLL